MARSLSERRSGGRAAACCVAAGGLLACKGSLPLVAKGPHVQSLIRTQLVDTRPPAARIESILKPFPAGCDWLDGHFEWTRGDWQWLEGRWVRPAAGCYYAEPLVIWVAAGDTGALYYLAGQWYSRSGNSLCQAPAACFNPTP